MVGLLGDCGSPHNIVHTLTGTIALIHIQNIHTLTGTVTRRISYAIQKEFTLTGVSSMDILLRELTLTGTTNENLLREPLRNFIWELPQLIISSPHMLREPTILYMTKTYSNKVALHLRGGADMLCDTDDDAYGEDGHFDVLDTTRGIFIAHNVIGDGRCLFRALSMAISGDEQNFMDYVNIIIDHVLDNWDDYKFLIMLGHDGFGDVSTPLLYKQFMSQPHTYGTIAEIAAISAALNIRIQVLQGQGDMVFDSNISLPWLGAIASETPDVILYMTGSFSSGHYKALKPVVKHADDGTTTLVYSGKRQDQHECILHVDDGYSVKLNTINNDHVLIGNYMTIEEATVVLNSIQFLRGKHAMRIQDLSVPSIAIKLMSMQQEQAVSVVHDTILVWLKGEQPLLTPISAGFKNFHECIALAVYGDSAKHPSITTTLSLHNDSIQNMNANTMLVRPRAADTTLTTVSDGWNVEVSYFHWRANSTRLRQTQFAPNHGQAKHARKVFILFDELRRRWFVLFGLDVSTHEVAGTYGSFSVAEPYVSDDAIRKVQAGQHEDCRVHPMTGEIAVSIPGFQKKPSKLYIGKYTDARKAIAVHDTALIMTRKVRKSSHTVPSKAFKGMIMDSNMYWHASCEGRRWTLPSNAYRTISASVRRPLSIFYAGTHIIWPIHPEIVLSTAVHLVNDLPVGLGNRLKRSAWSLLESIAYTMTGDHLAFYEWSCKSEFNDNYSDNLQKFADYFSLTIWLFSEDGRPANHVGWLTYPVKPSYRLRQESHDVYIMQHYGSRTWYEPLVPIETEADAANDVQTIMTEDESRQHSTPPHQLPDGAKRHAMPPGLDQVDSGNNNGNNETSNGFTATTAVQHEQQNRLGMQPVAASVAKRHKTGNAMQGTTQQGSQQPQRNEHMPVDPAHPEWKMTLISISGVLIDFANLSVAADSSTAQANRDTALIMTKRKRYHMNQPLKTYFHGPHGVMKLPEQVFSAINPHVQRPLGIKIPNGWILWPESMQSVWQSIPTTMDGFTFLRSMALLLHGSEHHYRVILDSIMQEINNNDSHYRRVRMDVADMNPNLQHIAWDGHEQLDSNLVCYARLLGIEHTRINKFELSAASNALGTTIEVYGISGQQLFTTTNLRLHRIEPTQTTRLLYYHNMDTWQFLPMIDLSSPPSHMLQDTNGDEQGAGSEFWLPENDSNVSTIEKFLCDRYALTSKDKKAIRTFWTAKHDTLTHVCFSCHRIFFESQVVLSSKCRRQYDNMHPGQPTHTSALEQEWVCMTCNGSIKQNKDSEYSIHRGYHMNAVGNSLKDLTYLEQRLVAANTPFMSISKRKGWQKALKGGIINVPNDLSHVMHKLPTEANAEATILVHFKRQFRFNSAYCSEAVRPAVVVTALTHLVANCRLWKVWKRSYNKMVQHINTIQNLSNSDSEAEEDIDIVDDGDGTEAEKARQHVEATQHTVIDSQHQLLLTFQREMHVAPAASSSPVSVFKDIYAEEKAFPCLFGGQKRQIATLNGLPIHYSRTVKWELCHYDRRFAMSIENIFFKLFKLRILAVSQLAYFKLKKGVHTGSLTREQALSIDYLNDVATKDTGFLDFKHIRGSPGYFQQIKKDAFAMLRQLGKPAWFFTLSCADTHWPEMQSLLHEVRYNVPLSAAEVSKMPFMQRSKLISDDPVTCVRYYHMRCMSFITNVLVGMPSAVGGVKDFLVRHEAQHRGSMHAHGMGYCPNAPEYDENDATSIQKVCDFVDQYITCSASAVPAQLLKLQIHSHNRHCLRSGNRCKADFPRPPMPHTVILHPLNTDGLDRAEINRIRNQKKCILQAMANLIIEMKTGHNEYTTQCSMETYQDFIESLHMSEHDYVTAIRFALHRPTVFLKRRPCEILINNYNPIALCLWRANMDLQYVVNAYAAASYATTYMTKTDTTTSVLMEATLARMADTPDVKIPDIIRAVGNAFINAQEVTAQEACYLTLGLPLKVATRHTTFVSTATPQRRHAVLRPVVDLNNLPANSTDVLAQSPIDHYKKRPAAMEKVCLADFVACYTVDRRCNDNNSNPLIHADGEADELIQISEAQDTAGLPSRAGKYKLKKTRGLLRWPNYDRQTQPTDYYRSMFMLFYPWHDEERELGCPTEELIEKFKCEAVRYTLRMNFDKYNKIQNIHDLEKQAIEAMAANDDTDADEGSVRNAQHPTQQFQAVNLHDTSTQALEHVHEAIEYDILQDIEATAQQNRTSPAQPLINQLKMTIMPQAEYHALINSLNNEQRQFHDHVVFLVKDNAPAWQTLVSGGAGVGKSHLLRAIDQSVKQCFMRQAGRDFTKTPVVIVAPTGTAAFNVKGLTIHTALAVPPNRDLGEFEFLNFEKANSLRTAWADVVLLIIDEISMVGNRMLQTINMRLQQLRGSSMPFGGISILAFGDLYQLKPVMDGWVFLPLERQLAALGPNLWRNFNLYELTQVMRQTQRNFIDRLNRLRVGQCTDADVEWYKQHEMPEDSPTYDPTIPHLFITNKQVDNHNAKYLRDMAGEITFIDAVDSILNEPDNLQACQAIMSKALAMHPTKTAGLKAKIELKLGAPVELTYNVDTADGLTNGATGTLCNWSITADNQVATIYVHFHNTECGRQARASHSSEVHKLGIQPSWTPIQRTTAQFKISKASTYTVQRQQFPIRLCAARTIHRVQGQSLPKALLDMKGRKQSGIHYVGMSRMITEEGLYLRNFRRADVQACPEVTKEYERMRNANKLVLVLPQLQRQDARCFTVTAVNARSLHSNIDNVRSHHNLLDSNLMLVTETWATQKDADSYYSINGFDMHRMDGNTNTYDQRPHRGMIAYNKDCQFHTVHTIQHDGCDILCGTVTTPYLVINIIAVYRCPQLAMKTFLTKLRDGMRTMPPANPCIIIGDFNIDIKGMSSEVALNLALANTEHPLKLLLRFMMKHSLTQMLDATTVDSGMQIDHIWSDIPTRLRHFQQAPFVLETVYSDHRPIGLQLTALA